MFETLLHLHLDIENPPLTCLDKLNDTEYNGLVRDDYRNCYHVPMMLSNDTGFEWTDTSREFPELVEWTEDVLFPWTGRSRIMIITTPPGETNPPHIDCSPGMFNTLQHKFRYVLQGNVDDLIFMSEQGDITLDQTVDKPFIMSGKWPHYMTNNTDKTKFTFAFGAPWDGDLDDENYVEILNSGYQTHKDMYKSYQGYKLPQEYEEFYQDNYKEAS
jgi:hypothetical protein